jgi:hypothetical protein
MARASLAGLVLSIALAGCGSSVVQAESSGSGSGTSTGSGGHGGGGGGTGGSTTVTTTSSGPGGGGEAPACAHTDDKLTFDLSPFDAQHFDCADPNTDVGQHRIDGAVTQVGGGTITIDSCPANENCAPLLSTLSFTAPGLAINVPVGAFVSLEYSVAVAMGSCSQAFVLQNLPTFNGLPNPVGQSSMLWLAGADGTLQTLPDSPFTVQTKPTCSEPSGVRNEGLVFGVPPGPMGGSIEVRMGMPFEGMVEGVQSWIIADLRSFKSDVTTTDDDYAYFVSQSFDK